MGDIDKLVWALQTGDLEEVKAKLITAEDANRTLQGGRTPLHYASDYGQTDMVEYLISKGANVDAVDKHGLTPLMSAIYENHIPCVKVLLEKGADKDRRAPDGCKASEIAETDAMRALFK